MYTAQQGRTAPQGGLDDLTATAGSLGIAPLVLAAVAELVPVLVGVIGKLFSGRGRPTAAQLAKAKEQAQFWVDRYAQAWAAGDRLRIGEVKATVTAVANNANWPDYWREWARNTLTVISQHDQQNPTPPAYTGPLIVGIETDAAGVMRRPMYLLPSAGQGYTQIGTTSIPQPDGSTGTVPLFRRDPNAPTVPADTASPESVAQPGGGGTFAQAGLLSGSGGLLAVAAVGTILVSLMRRRRG